MKRRLRFTEWSYINLVLGAFVFAPELRRLADWRGNYDPVNIFAALPTIMLVPVAFIVYRHRRRLIATPFLNTALVWSIGFAYAFLAGVVHTFLLPGIYGLGLFVLPALVGAWVFATPEPVERTFERISKALFFYGSIAGVYGVIQYVLAPPWDTAWMQSITAESFGRPERFGIRVFSVLNGPGVYAEFTAMCILMNLPNMRPSRPWSIAGSAAMFAGLLLSLVRSAWLAVIVGTILFTILSPQRIRAVRSLGTVFAVFAALAIGFFTFVPSDGVFQTLTDRVNTLSDISDDASAKDRAETSRVAFEAALGHPLGQGLGLTGSSGALAGSASALTDIPVGPIDNGFVSRFLEMGAPGFAAFLAAILMALALTYRALRVHLAERDRAAATVAAAAFATQAALFLTSLSGDVYAGVGSVLFFIAFGLGVKRATVAAKVRAPKRPAARIPARV